MEGAGPRLTFSITVLGTPGYIEEAARDTVPVQGTRETRSQRSRDFTFIIEMEGISQHDSQFIEMHKHRTEFTMDRVLWICTRDNSVTENKSVL